MYSIPSPRITMRPPLSSSLRSSKQLLHTSSTHMNTYTPRIAGIPQLSTHRSRPLTFPLGSFLGFLLGFTTASIGGYIYLLQSHTTLQRESSTALAELRQTISDIEKSSVELVGGKGSVVGELKERLSGLERDVGRMGELVHAQRVQREERRVEQRVVGVEEDLVEVREALLALQTRLDPSSARSSRRSLSELKHELGMIGIQPTDQERTKQRQSGILDGGLLWTGTSDPSRRIV